LRSAGVKTYIYHWIQHLWHHAGNEQILTFPRLNQLAGLNHEASMLSPVRTYSQLGLVYLANLQGLPLLKPPYGRLSAIGLDRGEILWQVAHGETPDSVRNHPALKGLTIPRTGQSGAVGALVTKTLVIMGDPLATTVPTRGRGAMLRAYDKTNGREVGAVFMPAQQSGTPMTYAIDGRQFIVVPISGGNYSGEYLAFALPR